MRKILMAVMALSLCMLLVVPTAGLADLTNSDTLRVDMTAEQFASLALELENTDLEIKKADDTTYYAELDATVIGLNAEDVTYDLTLTEADGTATLNAYHRGSDIGINRVKVTVYAPEEAIQTLTLNMTDSDLVIDSLTIGTVDGTVTGGKVESRDNAKLGNVSLNTTDTDISLKGEIGALTMNTTEGKIEMHSQIVPQTVTINATGADVDLKVPETKEGFVVTYDIIDGKLTTDFSEQVVEEKGTVSFGDGAATFDIQMTGGGLRVHKL